jgi:phenylacetate-CoA ligase
MCLRAEASDATLAPTLEAALQAATKLRGAVEIVPLGSLPNDGKVIDDTRPVTG